MDQGPLWGDIFIKNFPAVERDLEKGEPFRKMGDGQSIVTLTRIALKSEKMSTKGDDVSATFGTNKWNATAVTKAIAIRRIYTVKSTRKDL